MNGGEQVNKGQIALIVNVFEPETLVAGILIPWRIDGIGNGGQGLHEYLLLFFELYTNWLKPFAIQDVNGKNRPKLREKSNLEWPVSA